MLIAQVLSIFKKFHAGLKIQGLVFYLDRWFYASKISDCARNSRGVILAISFWTILWLLNVLAFNIQISIQQNLATITLPSMFGYEIKLCDFPISTLFKYLNTGY